MAENTTDNTENSETGAEKSAPDITVSFPNTITQLHQVALRMAESTNSAIKVENMAFDKNGKFVGANDQLMIVLAMKDEKAELLPKDKFVDLAKVYVKYFAGDEMASRITEKSLCEIYSPNDKNSTVVNEPGGGNGGTEDSQGNQQQNGGQEQQTQQEQPVSEEIEKLLFEDVVSPSYTGVYGYYIGYSMAVHGKQPNRGMDAFKAQNWEGGILGSIFKDLKNTKLKLMSGDVIGIGKIFDADSWKEALGIPDIDANNIDTDIKTVLNHEYPNNTAQVAVFKTNAANNLLSKQHRLTTEIQKFISQSELCIVIKVYHSDSNYPDYTTAAMADVFNKAAGSYGKQFRLNNRNMISDKNVLLVPNATDDIKDNDYAKRAYSKPKSGRMTPSGATGTSESETFIITGEILESLFGKPLLEDDPPETDGEETHETPEDTETPKDVEAPESPESKDEGNTDQTPANNEPSVEDMAKTAQEAIVRLGKKEFPDDGIDGKVDTVDDTVHFAKEHGMDEPSVEKWLQDNGNKAFMKRPFLLVDIPKTETTVSESVVEAAQDKNDDREKNDSAERKTRTIDKIARILASPDSKKVIEMLKNDDSFTDSMAKKFQSVGNENGNTTREKFISYISREDAPTLVKTGFRNVDNNQLEILLSRLEDYSDKVFQEGKIEAITSAIKEVNLTGNKAQNDRIEKDIEDIAKKEQDRETDAQKVLQDAAYEVMSKHGLKDSDDRFIFKSVKVKKEKSGEPTVAESIDSLLFESISPDEIIAGVNCKLNGRALELKEQGKSMQRNMTNLAPIKNHFAYAPRDRVIAYLTKHGLGTSADYDKVQGDNIFVAIVKRGDGTRNGSFGEPAFTDDSVKKMFEFALGGNLTEFVSIAPEEPKDISVDPNELFTISLGFNSVRYQSKVKESEGVSEATSAGDPLPLCATWLASGTPPGVDPDSDMMWLFFMYWFRGEEGGDVAPDSISKTDLYIIPRKNLKFKNDREIHKDTKDGNYRKIRPNNEPFDE